MPRQHEGFASFAALPSNIRAVESALLFANGLAPFVVIVGPAGWGKSHLLNCAQSVATATVVAPRPVPAVLEWLRSSGRADAHVPLLLDDCQEVFSLSRPRHELRLVLERRIRSGRATMLAFAMDRVDRGLRSLLPYSREWVVSEIQKPAAAERGVLVRQIAQRLDLTLCDELVRLISHHMGGNGDTITGSLRKLRLEQNIWVDVPSVMRAMGMLFAELQLGGWDARDYAFEVTDSVVKTLGGAHQVSLRDLAITMMRGPLGIPECAVAGYFGLDLGQVYHVAMHTSQRLRLSRSSFVRDFWEQQFILGFQTV